MPTDNLRVALAGRAEDCAALLGALRSITDQRPVTVVALAASDRTNPALRAELEGLDERVSVYVRVDEVLQNESLNAFLLATPLPQRHTHLQAALYSGCHVLVKAPPAITVRAATRVMGAAQENERLVAIFASERFSRRAQVVRWAVAEQIIGRPQFVLDAGFGTDGISPNLCAGTDSRRHDRGHGGGLLLTQSIRDIAFLRYACGDIVEVAAQAVTLEPERILRDDEGHVRQRFASHAEDTVGAQLRFANQAFGNYLRSWAGQGLTLAPRFAVWGSKGAVDGNSLYTPAEEPCDLEEEWKDRVGPAEIERLFPRSITTPLALELLSFLTAVQSWENGTRTTPPHAYREGLRDLAAAWALAEAGALGRKLTVAEVESLAMEGLQRDLNARWKIS